MAHLYGAMKGSRGEATRCGTKSSGIRAHVRGWDVGIRSQVHHDLDHDQALAEVTRGSNNASTTGDWMLCLENGHLSIGYTTGKGRRIVKVLRQAWPKVKP